MIYLSRTQAERLEMAMKATRGRSASRWVEALIEKEVAHVLGEDEPEAGSRALKGKGIRYRKSAPIARRLAAASDVLPDKPYGPLTKRPPRPPVENQNPVKKSEKLRK